MTKIAEKRLNALLKYLEISWSKKVKNKFVSTLEKRLEIVKENPEAFSSSSIKMGLHKCVITKQITVYYTFNEEYIFVLTVFDNRQDPEKLKYDLK